MNISRIFIISILVARPHSAAAQLSISSRDESRFGTLEEIMEILTLRQLDVVRKPCVFFNQDGFYDDLLRLFDKMLAEKFFKPSNMDLFRVANSVPDIFTQIEAAATAKAESKWFDTR